MTTSHQRIQIATACGWYDFGTTAPERGKLGFRVIGRNGENMDRRLIPDYLSDLNAMHEAELECIYSRGLGMVYLHKLTELVNAAPGFDYGAVHIKRECQRHRRPTRRSLSPHTQPMERMNYNHLRKPDGWKWQPCMDESPPPAHTCPVLLSEDHNRSFAVPATIDASTGLAGRLPQGDRESLMTPENAIELLKAEQANADTEAAHINADEIICKLLSALGYQDVVHEYDKVNKWFS